MVRLQKPMVVLRETDPAHGAATISELRGELQQSLLDVTERVACAMIVEHVERGTDIEWYREAHLKHAALCAILQVAQLK